MGTFVQDIRFALRVLAKSPIVTSVAVLSLALGIAASGAMFAVLNAFLFEPLPYERPDDLVMFREIRQGQSIEMSPGVSIPDFHRYAEAATTLEASAAYTIDEANLTGLDVPEQIRVVIASPNLFEVLGRQPFLGRSFRPEEGREGSGNVLVLHHDFWQSRFFGDPDVLGRTVVLDGSQFTIVGVMPSDFDIIPANVEAFRPTDFDEFREAWGRRGFLSFSRLRPGATLAQTQAELAPVAAEIVETHPETHRGWELRVQPASALFPGPTDRTLVLILTAVTLFGLVIACANVANLLLARAEMRRKEVSLRVALGAQRSRVLRQLLTESVVLGLGAGLIGLPLAALVTRGFQGTMPPMLPDVFMPRLDPGVMAASLATAVLAGILFGTAPAVHATGGNLRDELGSGGRGGAGRSRRWLRNAFVVGEFALALGLLTGAGYLTRAFSQVAGAEQGFDADGLLTFELPVAEDRYPEMADAVRYEREILRALDETPGVEGVALMTTLPRSFGTSNVAYTLEGAPPVEPTERPTAISQRVNPAYFETLGIPLLRGRLLAESDREDAPRVVVVSQSFANREFAGREALGQRIVARDESWEIVGVVADAMHERVPLAGSNGEAIYFSYAQWPSRSPSVAVRTAREPGTLTADVRSAVWAVNPEQPLGGLRTLEAHIDESLAAIRALTGFLTVMAAIALALAAMGIWGVMAHAVAQQRREIGIRMALGARGGAIVGSITRSGVALAAVGMLVGIPLAYVMRRGALSMLNLFAGEMGTSTAFGVAALLAVVGIVATYIPARRASRVDPVVALKE